MMDGLNPNQFSAVGDRHVGQRNIEVIQAASPASIDRGLYLGHPETPADAEVDVTVEGPANMEWLQLFAGRRNTAFTAPSELVSAGFFPPTAEGARVVNFSQLAPDIQASLL
jgi:hypothetical protein